MKKLSIFIALASIFFLSTNLNAKVEISADFDNGHIRSNAKITENGDKTSISFGPVNTNKELWFYYKLAGVKNKTITFTDNYEKATESPTTFHAISYKPQTEIYDNAYEKMEFISVNEAAKTASYTHTFREDTAYVSFSYVASNTMIDNYIKKISDNPYVKVETLGASTFYNLPLYLLTVTDKSVPDANKKVVFIWTREDSYEAGGTLGCWGALRYLLSNDAEASEIRKKFTYLFMPMFGRDGVKIGHTNWPLDPEGRNYIGSIQQNWPDNKDKIKEVDLLKSFIEDWKKSGKTIDIVHTMHSAPFADCCFFFWPINGEFKKKLKEYCSSLQKMLASLYTEPWACRRANDKTT